MMKNSSSMERKKVKQIYHHYKKWECFHAGFFNTTTYVNEDDAKRKYCEFLSDLDKFENGLKRVLKEWPISCEQFLTNDSINKIAWLGQAAMCIETRIPSSFRAGYKLLSDEEKIKADSLAKFYLIKWVREYEKKDKQIYLSLE